ncbi:C-type lectin domain family 10 member A-like isoform X2 [Cololabis saira]|uniref:C-type lectin domain family 10 member A-like isoform X2 n=1 Tax=Cololabis saira TaxID=129043 RepID=UPI002AD403FD|nr:C-type lectin domain family 10 member A-like isoform X2 [Cololabis saira]
MEEEINYSTLVFKNSARPAQKEKEEATIYSAIKTTPSATAEPRKKEEAIYSGVKLEESTTTAAAVPKAEEATNSRTRLLLVCLGIPCVLLVASIIVLIIYFTMAMNKQEADLTAKNEQLIAEIRNFQNRTEELIVQKRNLENQTEELNVEKTILVNRTDQLMVEKRVLENQTEQLMVEKRVLENQTEQLSRDRQELNRTLGIILTFDNFPVKDLCPGKKCPPCRDGWIRFHNKCYLFYHKNTTWLTWYKSRDYCKDRYADLVVIDDLQEQEFISRNIEYYYDIHHGYWLRLKKTNNNWVWIDDHDDTLGFWIQKDFKENFSYGLIIPRRNITENWSKNESKFENRFICEHDALTTAN